MSTCNTGSTVTTSKRGVSPRTLQDSPKNTGVGELGVTVFFDGDEQDEAFQHTHYFSVRELEQYHRVRLVDFPENQQVSMAEDYAIFSFYRKYGDMRPLRADVVLNNLSPVFDPAIAMHPVEISASQFNHALEIAPPDDWMRIGADESFKLSGLHNGLFTSIYVRIERRYFMFRDFSNLTHQEIIAKVRAIQELAA